MSQPNYQYDARITDAIQRCTRELFPPGTPLRRASLPEDYRGTDFHYTVDHRVPLQVRARFNRPAYAADSDITFRTTEPRMMAAHQYAPLALFCWFKDDHIVAAKLIDIYRMVDALAPGVAARPPTRNADGTGFHVVEMIELIAIGAVLRFFDGHHWATQMLGGEMRMYRIIKHWKPPDPFC